MRIPRPSGGNAGRGVQAAWLGGGMAERPVGQTLLALVVTLAAIPLILHLITQLFERPYAFYIDANSEVLELSTTELTGTRWYLGHARLLYQVEAAREERPPDALIPLDREAPDTEPSDFLGYLEIGPNAAVTLTRQGAGPLDIQIKPARSGDPPDASRLPAVLLEPLACDLPMPPHASASRHPNCGDDEEPTSLTEPLALREATLRVDIGESPLNGTLKGLGHIGGEPYQPTTPASPPLMRHGEVAVVGRRLVSEQIYTLMRAPLHLGDTVSVRGGAVSPPAAAEQEDSALFTCLFSVESKALEGKGIDLACHASGRSLAIGRYGDISRNDLAPRPWDVLINEPSMQATLPLAITGLFILVMRLLDGLYPRLCRKLSAGLARLRQRRS
ncbi:hypothetical protein ACGTN6_20270 [Halomonas sp. THAF12]|uniref:hypothetical protein n=1 Tax=Halomonas sp. B23F22_10 TaxID=3459515 RepID=UPI00373EFB24